MVALDAATLGRFAFGIGADSGRAASNITMTILESTLYMITSPGDRHDKSMEGERTVRTSGLLACDWLSNIVDD